MACSSKLFDAYVLPEFNHLALSLQRSNRHVLSDVDDDDGRYPALTSILEDWKA